MNTDLLKRLLASVKNPTPLVATGLGLGGAAAGGYIGHEITPKVIGFDESPEAKRMSAILEAAFFGTLAASPAFRSAGAAKLVPGWAATTMLPSLSERINRPDKPTATEQVRNVLNSNTGRGAAVGAAAAGLGGLTTGLLREKEHRDQSRGAMVTEDTLRYLIPALLAGGVTGSLMPGGQPQA